MIALSRWLIRVACLLCLGIVVSCYQSSEPLSKPGLVLDHALLGSWQCSSDPKEEAEHGFVVRIFQFDDSQYYVEWKEGEDLTRYRAYPTLLEKSVVVNVQEMSQGTEKQWAFIQYHLTQTNELTLMLADDKRVSPEGDKETPAPIRKRLADETFYSPLVSCIREKG